MTEVSYFALRSITPQCFPSLSQKTIAPLTPTFSLCCSSRSTMTAAAASEFAPSLLSVTGSQGPGRGEQHISQTDILMQQHPDPPPLDIHMTPPDDPLATVSRDLAASSITIPKYPNSAASLVGTESQPEKLEQGREPNEHEGCTSDAVASLQTNSLESLDGKTFRMSKGTAWCVIFMMRRRSKPAILPHRPRSRMVTQDVTLESELWTFDEVELHKTPPRSNTCQCRFDQRLPDCASELPKLLLKRLDHSRCVPGNSSSPWTGCSSTPQTPNGPTTQASPRQSGPVLRRQTYYVPRGCHGQTQPKDDPTYQVSGGRRGRSESRQPGQGHQLNGPRC